MVRLVAPYAQGYLAEMEALAIARFAALVANCGTVRDQIDISRVEAVRFFTETDALVRPLERGGCGLRLGAGRLGAPSSCRLCRSGTGAPLSICCRPSLAFVTARSCRRPGNWCSISPIPPRVRGGGHRAGPRGPRDQRHRPARPCDARLSPAPACAHDGDRRKPRSLASPRSSSRAVSGTTISSCRRCIAGGYSAGDRQAWPSKSRSGRAGRISRCSDDRAPRDQGLQPVV